MGSRLLKRIALNGRSYTEQEFAQWYGSQYRHWWMRACEDQAGATEHAQSGENQAGTVPLDQAGGEVHVRVHPRRQKE